MREQAAGRQAAQESDGDGTEHTASSEQRERQ
jgi:hypothetical protein